MKQNKLVIVVLIILAVMFALGQSANLLRDEKENKFSLDKAEKYIGFIDRAMARFRPVLDSARLKESKCETGEKTYALTDTNACDIIINRKDKAKFEKANVTVKPANGKVKVKAPYPSTKTCPETKKDTAESQQHLELSVSYFPEGKIEKPEKYCVIKEDLSLLVLEKGGKLRLKCKDCSEEKPVTVTLN